MEMKEIQNKHSNTPYSHLGGIVKFNFNRKKKENV